MKIARAMFCGWVGLALLSACGPVMPGPGPARCSVNACSSVSLASDPRTLQGAWVGEVQIPQLVGDSPRVVLLSLSLSARYQEEFFYTVSGTATLEGKTYAVRGAPTFDYDEKILKPQYQPMPNPPFLELLEGDTVRYSVPGMYWDRTTSRYQGNLIRNDASAGFALILRR